MAKYKTTTGLPDAIERREILAGNRRGVDLNALGRDYLHHGWLSDAADFFMAGDDEAGLEAVIERAARLDPFLLERISLTRTLPDHVWLTAAREAEHHGRIVQAVRLYERAGEPDLAAKLRGPDPATNPDVPETDGDAE